MRKVVLFIIIFILFVQEIYAYEPVDDTDTAQTRLDTINQQIREIYGLEPVKIAFPKSTIDGNVNESALMTSDLANIKIFYGSQFGTFDGSNYRYLGYTMDRTPYDNLDFKWDARMERYSNSRYGFYSLSMA